MLTSPTITVATWNVQWRRSDGKAAQVLRERMLAHRPDIVCLTEAPADFLGDEGHTIRCDPDTGYPIIRNRRKVLLWSKEPWEDVDWFGSPTLPSGRFIAGTTQTALGPLRALGVCIPWAGSHVSSGRKDRKRWEDHLRYLEALPDILEKRRSRYLVLGDFNQAIPRRTAPREVFASLLSNLSSACQIVTGGQIEGCGYAIDHIAVSDDLEATIVKGLPAEAEGGPPLSDHFGVVASLRMVLSRGR